MFRSYLVPNRPKINLFNAQTRADVIYCLQRGDNINEYHTEYGVGGITRALSGLMYDLMKPIDIACKQNKLEVFDTLLENGANIMFDYRSQYHPIYYAIENGNYYIV